MSETPTGKGHGNSSVGSFSQFRFETRTPRQRTHEATWKRLAETVPRTEDEWRLARQHVFSTAEEMSNTLTELLNPAKKTYLYEIIFLASRHTILCCDSEQRQMVYSDLRDFFSNPDLDDGMLERYMKSVVRLIKVLDELYLEGLLHRAFEAILYIPVQRSHLRQYGEHPDRFKSVFLIQKPPVEIHGSLLLYIPFLVHYTFPHLSLTSARDALNSRLLGESEYHLFENAIKTKTFVPRLPPLPPLALPLCVVQHFDVFKLPSNLQSALSELAVQLRGYNPMPSSIPGETQMYAYEWPGANEVIREILKCLTSQGLLKGEEYAVGTPYAIHHDSGPLPTPSGSVQVIVPIIKDTAGTCQVSLGSYTDSERWASWDAGQGFLLNQGTFLLPKHPIDYILTRFRI
ncbi:hypothetical protein FOPG_16391 [Fusarium oxysporum f. sp. conglutinans race 2 54008]|uniref:Uncharacterized protein n=1 Tax=Fusarium oxysporum f. sp. conglutinans race 2 54008 TaxID=1089457 RepID=X0GV36_FUSOX|nr:hypothetical protein FOPG_16391 [Fusarium oxysporum f. sp. conglutinans race 2 54008]